MVRSGLRPARKSLLANPLTNRSLKNLVVVDDGTHETVAVVCEHTISGGHLTRILDGICSQRGRPSIIRSDNGPEFTGKSMLTWVRRNGIALRLIEPGNETWRKEYNDERPKKSLGGITPSQYAKRLARKAVTMPKDSKALR